MTKRPKHNARCLSYLHTPYSVGIVSKIGGPEARAISGYVNSILDIAFSSLVTECSGKA